MDDSSSLMTKVARLCFLARKLQGIRIDPSRFVQDPVYRKSMLDAIQMPVHVDDELLALALSLSVLSSTKTPGAATPPQSAGDEATDPKIGKDYKFGPRG
jgi:hypothetical protein